MAWTGAAGGRTETTKAPENCNHEVTEVRRRHEGTRRGSSPSRQGSVVGFLVGSA